MSAPSLCEQKPERSQMSMLGEVLSWMKASWESVLALSLVGIVRCALIVCLCWLFGGIVGLTVLVACNALYIVYCYRGWRQVFSERHRRGSILCPSSTLLPPEASHSVRTEARRLSEEGVISVSPDYIEELHSSVSVAPAEVLKYQFATKDAYASKGSHSGSGSEKAPFRFLRDRSRGNSFLAYGRKLLRTSSRGLDMDHIKVSLHDYLWAMYFIGPNAVALWCFGIAKLLSRRWLCNRGWIAPRAHDPAKVVGDLILQSVGEVTNFVGMKNSEDEGKEGPKIGLFLWPEFAILDEDGVYKVSARPLSVQVCLDSGRMIHASMGSRELSARDALVLVWFHTVVVTHPKLHALANWSVNNETQRGSDFWRDSVATAMYNHFGYSVFPKLCELFHVCGVTSLPFKGIQEVFNHGLKEGVSNHRHIVQLMKYSRSVSFITKLRNHFLNDFAENKSLFPGTDGEALFVRSVVHSLDHQLMEWNIADPLWITPDSDEFAPMAEFGQIVRVGFVSDLPFLNFNRKISQSSNPFWKAVYAHATRLDPSYADSIDTCIIR